jgi:hypothetical protein
MSRQMGKINGWTGFSFNTSSEVVARRFRDHCHNNRLKMGTQLEIAMIDYLIKVGDVESEEALRIEEELAK